MLRAYAGQSQRLIVYMRSETKDQMSNENVYHLKVLTEQLASRTAKNPRYSLRAFASFLELHPSALSRIFSGKQDLTVRAALQVADKLGFDKEDKRLFLQSVVEERKRRDSKKLGEEISVPELRIETTQLDVKTAAKIFNLTAHSILQLTCVDDFNADPEWIARRLGRPRDEIESAMEGLLALGFLVKEEGKLKARHKNFSAVSASETDEIKRSHQKQILNAAAQAIDSVPLGRRGHYGLTITIDPAKVPQANDMIMRFMESMCDTLETGTKKEVYQIAVQLFPLSQAIS